MRRNLIILVVLFATSVSAQHIEFPLDTNSVTIDGDITAAEWQNAETILINVNTAETVSVMFKHDGNAMYFAFSGKLESANSLFPEVLADPKNTGGSAWSNGQWWFHVSATDCEDSTGYGIYNNCMAVQPDWLGAPNFTVGPPATDSVEIRIPFSKVGFDPVLMDTMGIVMMVTNTATAYHLYPTSADKNTPDTWAKATFSKFYAGINAIQDKKGPDIYPNPVTDVLHVDMHDTDAKLAITDMFGRILYSQNGSGKAAIPVSSYSPGIYTISIETKHHRYNKLFTRQ